MLGHVADGNFHALLLWDPADDAAGDAAHWAAKELTREVIALGGTCTGEHGIGLGKREALVDQPAASTVKSLTTARIALCTTVRPSIVRSAMSTSARRRSM